MPKAAAYVGGASQVVNWELQDDQSYDWAMQEARRTGNNKALMALDQIGRPMTGQYASGTNGVKTQRRWLGTLGGVAADPRFVPLWALSVFTSRGYPVAAKLHYLKAMDRSMDLLWPTLCEEVDFQRDATAFAVPVHLFAGRQDWITDLAQIEQWLAVLRAPAKRLDIVGGAGHLNLYEQPDRFITFMDEVRTSLACQPDVRVAVAIRLTAGDGGCRAHRGNREAEDDEQDAKNAPQLRCHEMPSL